MRSRIIFLALAALIAVALILQPARAGADIFDRAPVVPDDSLDCPDPVTETGTDPNAAPGGADWASDPTSAEYQVAQQVYDSFTSQFGVSGAFAVGVIANMYYESGLSPDRAEGGANFGMNSKTAPAGMAGGGGGLVQFTPYTKFTESSYWALIDPQGWGVANQIAAIWNMEFANGSVWMYASSTNASYGAAHYGKSPAFASLIQWCSTVDPALSCQAFQVGYERPKNYHPEREDLAIKLNSIFNAANLLADPTKLAVSLGAGSPTLDGTQSAAQKSATDQCEQLKAGILGSGKYLTLAQQYADDDTIGYSQDTRCHNPNMDCSSFVWYSLTDSGFISADELGGAPFSTATMLPELIACGWTQQPFNAATVQAGMVLWRDGHTELALDATHSIGAHTDKDGVDGDSSGLEVCAVTMATDWTYMLTPPAAGK